MIHIEALTCEELYDKLLTCDEGSLTLYQGDGFLVQRYIEMDDSTWLSKHTGEHDSIHAVKGGQEFRWLAVSAPIGEEILWIEYLL